MHACAHDTIFYAYFWLRFIDTRVLIPAFHLAFITRLIGYFWLSWICMSGFWSLNRRRLLNWRPVHQSIAAEVWRISIRLFISLSFQAPLDRLSKFFLLSKSHCFTIYSCNSFVIHLFIPPGDVIFMYYRSRFVITMYLYYSIGMYNITVLSHSDSCMYWCLAYICEGISALRMYVTVTSSYSRNWGITRWYQSLGSSIFNTSIWQINGKIICNWNAWVQIIQSNYKCKVIYFFLIVLPLNPKSLSFFTILVFLVFIPT